MLDGVTMHEYIISGLAHLAYARVIREGIFAVIFYSF